MATTSKPAAASSPSTMTRPVRDLAVYSRMCGVCVSESVALKPSLSFAVNYLLLREGARVRERGYLRA